MKKFATRLFLLLIVFSAVTFAQDADNEAKKQYNEGIKIYKEGNKLRKSGDYAGAVAKYDDALKLTGNFSTDDYAIYYYKGVTLKKLRKFEEAKAALIKAAERKPDFAAAYNAVAGIEFANGEYVEAIAHFEKFKEHAKKKNLQNKADQSIAQSYTKIALKEKADGKFDKAVETLNKAISYSKFDKAYLAKAEILVDLQKWDEAIQAADNALNNRDKVSKGGPLYFKGMAFKGKGDLEKAKECFQGGKNDKMYGQNCKYELESL